MTEEGEDAVLAGLSPKARRAFVDLIGCGLMDRDEHEELYRPYSHQVTMLKRGVRDGQAGIVTSGTRSGKTEAFLLPILASIVEEATRDRGGWPRPESGYLSSENRWWRGQDGQPMAKRNLKGEYELKQDIKIKGLDWNSYKDHEQRQGEQRPAAIRALILYPMNALVEDQMTRLRMALDSQDARDTLDHHLNGNRVFFGHYTGQTKGGPAYLLEHEKALRNLRRGEGTRKLRDKIKGCDDNRTLTQWKKSIANSRKNRIEDVIIELSRLDDLESAIRREADISSDQQVGLLGHSQEIQDKAFAFPALDGAEMVTRWDMQGSPPDILVTNISMLNAMLSRKTEACMLEKTREWLESDPRNRFTLVIDELHLQRGSAGTEFMYLLRLLFVRLGLDQPERHHQLRLLASSASLPVDEEDARGKEASLNYLYDAFADFGLGRGSGREDWIEAIVPGKDKYAKDGEHPDLSFDATDLDKAIDVLMKTSWGTGENEDNILPEPGFENHREDLTVFLDALHVPNWNRLEERWEWLASAVGCAFEKACCRADGSVVATSLDEIFKRCWPNHGWSSSKVERNMRLLTAVVSAADHSSTTGEKLRNLRQDKLWPVPRFRLHTFFRVPQGLFVDVVPPAWRSEKKPQRWQGELSIERTGTTRARNSNISVRQFELLSCECCGECFIGGIRADQKDNGPSIIEELLPNEEDIESLPDLSISNRFEEYKYTDYVIFWPRDKNDENFDDNINKEKWKQVWLSPMNGAIFNENLGENLQPGYLFVKISGNNLKEATDQSPGSHMPCRCPRCKIDYGPKRAQKGNRQPSLLQFSPLRSQRSGLERTTQLLASELYGVLAREGDSSRARLVSFSDSRQAAARTALGVEQLHHRDVLREILLRAILSESKDSQSITQQSQNDINLLKDDISQKRRSGLSDSSPLVKPLLDELKRMKIPALYQSQRIIPLESILELEPPQPDVLVKSFLAQLIKLRIHPFCERGITKLTLPNPDNKFFNWWELFTDDGNGNFKWSLQDSNLDDEMQYKELCRKFLDKILARIGRIVFDKTYFALEATGLAYPVPRPPENSLLQGEVSEPELSKAAAWMRIYTDNYRFAPFPPEWEMSNRTQKITLEQVERRQSYLAKLIQDSADALGKNHEDLFNNMQQLMNRYGHSTDDRDYIRLEKIAFRVSQDGDPCWHCTNCRRVHLHRGLGFCTRCGTKLPDHATGSCAELQRDNFLGRRLRHSLFQDNSQENPSSGTGAFRLRCEELTGQTIDPASRQREFKSIRLPAEHSERHPLEPQGIEMLSVTTTMEVGIDIGPLEAIVQANMPPQRFNYQQRVGRAGRRGQAFSFVLTLCRSRSHDLHYFRHPEAITGDAPPPPFLVKRLPRIAERLLCKDQLVAAFRQLEQGHRDETGGFWLGDLVKPVDVHGDFIPAAILKNTELLEKWKQWLHKALQFSDVQIKIERTLDAIKRGNSSNFDNSLSSRSSESLWQEIIKHKETLGGNTVGLAAHLANYGLLPMYGLPTRVRELVLGKSKNSTEPTESLSRDLEVAIYEYAPGNVLIHDKQDHRCIGLTPRIGFSFTGNKRNPETLSDNPWDRRFRLGQCPKCWAWKDVGDKTDEKSMIECPSCQNKSPLRDWHSKWCLEPAAFRTDFKPQTKLVERLPGSSSNSLCADSKPPESGSWKEKCYDDPEKTVRTAKISLTTSDSTIVYRLNQGTGKQGFSLSWQNGVMSKGRSSSSESPLKAQAIDERILSDVQRLKILNDEASFPKFQEVIEEPIYLAAPRVTDGLYLLPQKVNSNLAISYLGDDEEVPYLEQRNSSRLNSNLSGKHYWQGIRAAAISASEILISAATRHLDIELRSLQAVEPRLFRHQGKEKLPMLQIVDEHVNGAGFSDWLGHGDSPLILKVLSDILNDQAEEWATEDHQSKYQEACYRCLKSYDNQNLHGLLDWRLGLAYLRSFTDPSWQCGLDGDFSWSPLQQWPETALRLREDTLKLWSKDKPDNRKEYPIPNSSDKIYAFRLGSRCPWVIIRHPLWRWELEEGPLAEFASQIRIDDPDYQTNGNVLCWDTFNLSRRPGRTRQWMAQQQPRRWPRRRR